MASSPGIRPWLISFAGQLAIKIMRKPGDGMITFDEKSLPTQETQKIAYYNQQHQVILRCRPKGREHEKAMG